MFHRLETVDDYLTANDYIFLELPGQALVDHIVDYFTIPLTQVIYPAKSYAVAIIYAQLLKEYFGVPFFKSLDDPDLFMGTDKYYIPYSRAKHVYDQVLERINYEKFNRRFPQTRATISYFRKEFYINKNQYFSNN